MRTPPALFVALLVVATVAPAAAVADTGSTQPDRVVTVDNATNYLAIRASEVQRTGRTRADMDLSVGFAMDTRAVRADFLLETFERDFRAAGSDAERSAAVRSTLDRIERLEAALDHRDRAAIRGYANGSLSTTAFVRHRARIHSDASHLQRVIQRVSRVAGFEAGYSMPLELKARLANLAGELEVLQGPASGRLGRATTGAASPRSVYAEASTRGYTLAYVTETTYVRETYLGNRRAPNATDKFRQGSEPRRNAAHNRGFELYPWVTNRSVTPNTFGLGTAGIYRFTVDWAGGDLTAYISGGTTDAFREAQHRQLSAVDTEPAAFSTNDTLAIQVNRSFVTGPMSVSVYRTDTGERVNATVQVGGRRVGHTGEDGRLWAVQPRRRVRINATTAGGARVTTSLAP